MFNVGHCTNCCIKKICEHVPGTGYWRIVDEQFAKEHNMAIILTQLTSREVSYEGIMINHRRKIDEIRNWSNEAGTEYYNRAKKHLYALNDYASVRGIKNNINFFNDFDTLAHDAGNELQNLANEYSSSISKYNEIIHGKIDDERIHFNNITEDYFTKVGELVGDDVTDPNRVCVNQALRDIIKIYETYYYGVVKSVIDEEIRNNSLFMFRSELEATSDDFNTLLGDPCKNCVDDAVYNHVDEIEVLEAVDKCVELSVKKEVKDIIDSENLSKKAIESRNISLKIIIDQVSKLTEVEAKKYQVIPKKLQTCLNKK